MNKNNETPAVLTRVGAIIWEKLARVDSPCPYSVQVGLKQNWHPRFSIYFVGDTYIPKFRFLTYANLEIMRKPTRKIWRQQYDVRWAMQIVFPWFWFLVSWNAIIGWWIFFRGDIQISKNPQKALEVVAL